MEASILDLKGRNAIVTGGSLGIGAAIAVKLAENGANVAINYRRHDKAYPLAVRRLRVL